ncbi:MAG: ArsR family transcriptional regulator [Candidatus Methanoperedens sp.]|nr:ArsR family transcriptional regulator [Candidatus Methanoperedens sp.]
MKKLFLLCIFLILGMHVAGAESIITVNVNESGTALWTMEKRLPLTKPELNEWEAAIKSGQNISRYKDVPEFNDTINQFQRSSQNFSNRSMEIADVNISFDTLSTVSGDFGIIRYAFLWTNFSRRDSDSIFVGDAFSGMVLSPDSVLIINIPEGYNVMNVSPSYDQRDGSRLIWGGTLYRNFSIGEPALVLSRSATSVANAPENFMWPLIIISIVVIVSVALVVFLRRKRSADLTEKGNESKHEHGELKEILKTPEVWNNLVQLLHKEFGTQSVEELEKAAREQRLKKLDEKAQTPRAEEDLEYEEKIEQYLLRSGGQAYQSDIVKESGLSKSKISMVLAAMKEDGLIIKIRKGKENLIRLVK